MSPMSRQPGLLVASVDFGYGSSGKLSSIVAELPGYRCVLAGSTHSRHVTRSERFEAYYPRLATPDDVREVVREHQLAGALVVLNPHFAELCVDSGVQTVYVDSLAYLWTDHDPVPTNAALYCAQQFPLMPDLAWPTLRRIGDLRWVEGIVPAEPTGGEPPEPFDAMVNLGGLGTHLLRPKEAAYPGVVVDAALTALAKTGARTVWVTGNLAEVDVTAVLERHPELTVRIGSALRHDRFQALLRAAPLVLTSPGLTTLIESGAAHRPTVVLPPQNLSQFFNAEAVALCSGRPDAVVTWPGRVVDRAELETVRRAGEDEALRYLYTIYARHRDDGALVRELAADTVTAIERVGTDSATAAYVDAIGTGGAGQVAGAVRELFGGSA
jgi:hydroxymethylcytosylglucuronate/cytosylglucuronate synthase